MLHPYLSLLSFSIISYERKLCEGEKLLEVKWCPKSWILFLFLFFCFLSVRNNRILFRNQKNKTVQRETEKGKNEIAECRRQIQDKIEGERRNEGIGIEIR